MTVKKTVEKSSEPHTVNVEAGVYAPPGVDVEFQPAPQDAAAPEETE